jgi:hypothetical protein
MVRNDNSICHRGHHQIWLERHLFLFFIDTLAVVLGSLTLQDKYNIYTLFNVTAKYGRKDHHRFAFLPVSTAGTNQLYIFQQCTYIDYTQPI